MTEEFTVRFRAFEGSPHITQWPAYGKTVLTVPKDHPQQGRVIAVLVDGKAQKFRSNENDGLVINFLRLEGAYIAVVCLVPKEPMKLPQYVEATSPAPRTEYGLQRQISPSAGGL